MRHSRFGLLRTFVILATLTVAVAGCSSPAHYDPKIRRERLLAIYPPGQTFREDVRQRWAPLTPEFTAVRPADGWGSLDKAGVPEHVAASERRTGRPVWRVDCYMGPDGFLGLCYCW